MWNKEDEDDTNKDLEIETGKTGNQRKNGDNPDLSIIKIGCHPEKSPIDLRIVSVTQTPMKNSIK